MKGFVVLVTCFYIILQVYAQEDKIVTYSGNQLWKISINNNETFKFLEQLQNKNFLTLWGKSPKAIDVMIHADSLDKVKEELTNNHLQYQVNIADIQRAIDTENPEPEELDHRQGHRLTWTSYHRLDDIYNYLDFLIVTFPKLCSVETIGTSSEGRPIKLLKISNGNSNNSAIFIDGGIHAREWISPATLTYIIHQFVHHNNEEADYIKNIDWYIIPVLNPDGYEYSHTTDRLWRKNRAKFNTRCVGVDLNRNFEYGWDIQGASKDPCSRTYRGSTPFSELETKSVAEFFQSHKLPWKAFISMHSYGQYILYPWGSSTESLVDMEDLQRVGVQAASAISSLGGPWYTVGPTATTIYKASGSSMDWARGTLGIKYVYTIELRDNGRYGFLLPATYIQPTAKEALIAIRTIAKAI